MRWTRRSARASSIGLRQRLLYLPANQHPNFTAEHWRTREIGEDEVSIVSHSLFTIKLLEPGRLEHIAVQLLQ